MKNMIRMSLVAGALVSSVAAQAQTAWTDKVTLGGDLRVRQNRIVFGGATNNTELRGRLTASAKVNEAMTANFRLATTSSGTTGTPLNNTDSDHEFNGGAGKAGLDLELAYGDWRLMSGLVASVGKAPNPFWQAGKNEMLWDADLAFDGVSAKWAADMGGMKPFLNATYSWMAQNEAAAAPGATNVMLLGGQAGASMGFGEALNGTLAVGYHHFNNAAGFTAAGTNLWLVNVGAEVGVNMITNLPLTIYADWVQNTGGTDNEDEARLAGISAGQFNNVGSWQAWYNYRDVGSTAVAPELADSEFGKSANGNGSQANIFGHQVGAGYMAWENTTVGLNYMAAKVGQTANYDRWMADLVWKF